MKKLVISLVAIVPLFIISTASAGPPAPVPVLSWTPCGDAFPGAECAVATVPLDHDQPLGETTWIALARIPAADQAGKIGSVFVNPGGPGGSGVGFVLSGFGDLLAPMLGGRFDVVGFDPRGVANSDPIQCFDTNEIENAFLAPCWTFPYRRDQLRPYYDCGTAYADVCLARGQRITPHVSTAAVVRDLDLLRQAVGDERLTYLGFSYGSYIGNTYANLFPDKVRALAIDGVIDPRLWSSGWQIVSDRVATAKEFDEFLRLCDEAADACALSAPGGAAARFDALAAALWNEPLVFEDGSVYSYDLLVVDAVIAMYAPEYWGGPDGYGAYFAFLAEAVLGDAGAAQRAAAIRQAILDQLRAGAAQRREYDNGIDAMYGTSCGDTEYPSTFIGFVLVGAYAERGSIFGPFWWWQGAPCAAWPVSSDRYLGPWAVRTSAPVLVVGNYFDGITDYAGAVASSELLKNSRLLSYAGWGHTAFSRSDCVTEHVIRYLLDGTLPPKGTVCPANPNPFLPTPQLRAVTRAPLVGLPPEWLLRR